jgi:hypothetical protein
MTDKTIEQMASEAARASWQYRAIAATRGNQTRLGAVLLGVLGKSGDRYPAYGLNAEIDAHGVVWSAMHDRYGNPYRRVIVGDVEDLTNNFRGLADHLKLSDGERKEMFDALRKWISHDYRVKPEYDLWK